jgi:hypothetical protein
MNKMNDEKIKGIARHLLTLIGGILITVGILSAEVVDLLVVGLLELIGGGLTVWGVIASVKNKDKNDTTANRE